MGPTSFPSHRSSALAAHTQTPPLIRASNRPTRRPARVSREEDSGEKKGENRGSSLRRFGWLREREFYSERQRFGEEIVCVCVCMCVCMCVSHEKRVWRKEEERRTKGSFSNSFLSLPLPLSFSLSPSPSAVSKIQASPPRSSSCCCRQSRAYTPSRTLREGRGRDEDGGGTQR